MHSNGKLFVYIQGAAAARAESRVAADRGLLSPANVAGRPAFARQHLAQHDGQFWRKVVFTDEETFDTSRHGRQIVYR